MKNLSATKLYALAFGLFLGLCIWKFGNPVILDQKISTPATPADFFNDAWPTHWANWILFPVRRFWRAADFSKKSFMAANQMALAAAARVARLAVRFRHANR